MVCEWRKVVCVCATIGASAILLYEGIEKGPRYQFIQGSGVLLRGDTRSGEVAVCRVVGPGDVQCL
jgi:hypothetical protein